MQLGQLPKNGPESCRAWLYGKMLYSLLCYAIVDKGRSFSRGMVLAMFDTVTICDGQTVEIKFTFDDLGKRATEYAESHTAVPKEQAA